MEDQGNGMVFDITQIANEFGRLVLQMARGWAAQVKIRKTMTYNMTISITVLIPVNIILLMI